MQFLVETAGGDLDAKIDNQPDHKITGNERSRENEQGDGFKRNPRIDDVAEDIGKIKSG